MSREDSDALFGFSGAAWTQSALSEDPNPLSETRYRLDSELGRGGMGVVYLATDLWLGRQVALKRPKPGVAAAVIDRMIREAALTARLTHPSIPPVLDVGEDEAGPFYTVPVLSGTPMSRWNPESTTAWVQVLRDAARALGHAHRQGIVHRDIKPDNLLIGPMLELWVLDWGVAYDPQAPDRAAVGTAGWAAPEQAQGQCTPASDVFALGRLLLAHPELGDGALQAVAQRAAQVDAGQRYPSADALADELDRWLSGTRVRAHHYSLSEVLWTTLSRYRGRVAAVGVGTLLAGAGLVSALVVQTTEQARTEQALAQGLAIRAAEASKRGARAEAERLAVSSLLLAESPLARGVLARWSATPRPRLQATGSSPCVGGWRHDGTQLCRESEHLTLYDRDTPLQRWPNGENPKFPFAELRWTGSQLLSSSPVNTWTEGVATLQSAHPGPFKLASGTRAVYANGTDIYEVVQGRARLLAESACSQTVSIHGTADHVLVSCKEERVVVLQDGEMRSHPLPGHPVLARWAEGPVVATFEGEVLLQRDSGWQRLPTNAGAVESATIFQDEHLVITTETSATRVLRLADGRWLNDLPGGFEASAQVGEVLRLFDRAGWSEFDGAFVSPQSVDLSQAGGVADMAWSSPGGPLIIGSADGSVVEWRPQTGVTRPVGAGTRRAAKPMGWFRQAWIYPEDGMRHGEWRDAEQSFFSELIVAGDIVLLRGYGANLGVFDGSDLTRLPIDEHVRGLAWGGDLWWASLASGELRGFQGTETVTTLSFPSPVYVLAATPTHLAIAQESELQLVSVNGAPLWQRPLEDIITALALSPDYAVAGLQDGSVQVFDTRDGTELARITAHQRRVSDLLLDGETLVSASWDGWVHRMDLSVLHAETRALQQAVEQSWGPL